MSAFTTSRTLAFGDCDPSGIAYFPSYLHLLVTVLEAFFADLGFPWPALVKTRRIGTPTVTLDLAFAKPGFHGDRLDFTASVERVGGSSLDLAYTVRRAGETLWTARQRVVATGLDDHRAHPWPDDLRAALLARLEPAHA